MGTEVWELTHEDYADFVRYARTFLKKHLPDLDPVEAEDLANEALSRLLARGDIYTRKNRRDPVNQFFFRCMYTTVRDMSYEPLLRARGLRTRSEQECLFPCREEVQVDFDTLPGELTPELPLERQESLNQIRQIFLAHRPQAGKRYFKLFIYCLKGLSVKEMARREKVSPHRMESLLAVMRRTLRDAYYMQEMTEVLDSYRISHPHPEELLDEPEPWRNL